MEQEDSGLTLADVRKWPPTVNISHAAEALGVSRASLYAHLAMGERPVRVIRVGSRWKVVTASLIELLESGSEHAESA